MIDNTTSLKYHTVIEELETKITTGKYKPGQQLPTQKKLTEHFNISRPTLDKAMEHLENKGLVFRRKGSGTFVSENIKPSAQHKFGIIALRPPVEKDFEQDFIQLITSKISNESQNKNFTLLTDTSSFYDESEILASGQDTCDKFTQEGIEGAFYVPLDFSSSDERINALITSKLENAGIKVVLLDRDIYQLPKRSSYDVVGINNRRASFIATRHLIDNSVKDIYFISCSLHSNAVSERIEGFKQALKSAKINTNNRIIFNYNFKDPENSSKVFSELMSLKPTPKGFVCINDEAASVVMRDAIRLGLRVPQDLKIVGFDDLPTSKLLFSPLTTIKQPIEAIAKQAVKTMFDRIDDPHTPARDIYVAEELIERESSK